MITKLLLLLVCKIFELNKSALQILIDEFKILAGIPNFFHYLAPLFIVEARAERESTQIPIDAGLDRVNHIGLLLVVIPIFPVLLLALFLLLRGNHIQVVLYNYRGGLALHHLLLLVVIVLLVNFHDHALKKLGEGAV